MNDGAPRVRSLAAVPTVQNSVRFFEQLHSQGYADDDLRRARAVCGTAQVLFTGRMHSSGKPFLAHCIGTAGALAALGTPVELVAAGLVHDAYPHGDFGPWKPFRALKRRQLQHALGEQAEQYVQRYDRLCWDGGAVEGLRRRLPDDETDRGAVLIRLASELDDLRDRNVLYSTEAEAWRERTEKQGPALVAIAEALGFPALSAALATAVEETLASEVPSELRSRVGQTSVLPPESATPKLEAVVIGALAGTATRPGGRREP